MNRIKQNFALILRGIRLLFNIEKKYTVLHIVTCSLTPLMVYVNIYLSSKIVNALSTSEEYKTILLYIVALMLLTLIFSLLNYGLNHIKNYHLEQFYKNESMMFSEKNMSLDYEDVENAKINLLRKQIDTESQTGYNTYQIYTLFGNFISAFVDIFASFFLTVSLFTQTGIPIFFKLLLPIVFVIIILTNYYSTKKENKLLFDMYEKSVHSNVVENFYSDFYSDYNAGKDVRIYAMEDFITQQQKEQNIINSKILSDTKRKSLKYISLKIVAGDILTICAYIIVVYACYLGDVLVGDIARYTVCLGLMMRSVISIISIIQELLENNKYLQHYFSYLDIENRTQCGNLPVKSIDEDVEIDFINVSFKYPNTTTYVLKNVCFKIKAGERIALVGKNGSGKTTIIKLICRFYSPTDGKILINGVDISSYDYNEYKKYLSVVFQDFRLFSFSIAQNIACSENYDRNRILTAIRKSGFEERLNSMPNNIETTLYRDFEQDGIEISKGEAQKIAIARALYKNASLLIFDEPTASLDPIAEAEIYFTINENIKNITTIFISHRLSSCRFCNKILVMDNGKIVQEGSHDMLVDDSNGLYHELWNAQAQYYIKND